MTTVATEMQNDTLADLLLRLGSIPPERIAAYPPPGAATEEDLLAPRHERRLYELVDGVLVEKAMGYYESYVAVLLGHYLEDFLEVHDLGIVLGSDGMLKLAPGLVRAPDISFISWESFPGGRLVPEPVPNMAPDLAVEVLSAGNTVPEMERKLKEYFAAGSHVVWLVEPKLKTVRVFTSPTEYREFDRDETLDGGALLPGFRLSIREWFSRADRRMPPNPSRRDDT